VSELVENVLKLSGPLTMNTIAELFGKGLQSPEGNSDLVVDFARVEAVDSSAVSLMLSWLRTAKRKNLKLSFVNVPENLRSLANLYGVAESLSLPVEAS
jgi:phospholipid transport system transporter-binding protein